MQDRDQVLAWIEQLPIQNEDRPQLKRTHSGKQKQFQTTTPTTTIPRSGPPKKVKAGRILTASSEASSLLFRLPEWPQDSWFTGPIKQTSDLKKLAKPVWFQLPSREETQKLPEDIKKLDKKVRTTQWQGFIPLMAREYVKRLIDEDTDLIYYDDNADDNGVVSSTETSRPSGIPPITRQEQTLQEVRALLGIVERTKKSIVLCRNESAWNAMVHEPLLALALAYDYLPEVREEYISAATIMPSCVPRLKPINEKLLMPTDMAVVPATESKIQNLDDIGKDSGYSGKVPDSSNRYGGSWGFGGKMVDFALVLDPEEASPLEETIAAVTENLAQETGETSSVNQTTYNAVRSTPIAVAISTKTQASATNIQLQLALWTVAWHQRMEAFAASLRRAYAGLSGMAQPSGGWHTSPPLVTLPFIAIVDHEWFIYYACDRGDRIVIIGPENLGSTQTLTKCYILLRNLRHVSSWIDDEFRQFLVRFFVEKRFLALGIKKR